MSTSAAKVLQWLPARWRPPALLRPIGLQARIALLVSSGVLVLIAFFVILGLAALRDSTDRDLQGRVALAQSAAEHLDFVLGEASSAAEAAANEVAPALGSGDLPSARVELQGVQRRLAGFADGLLLFSPNGELLQVEPVWAVVAYPGLGPDAAAALKAGKVPQVEWVQTPSGGAGLAFAPVVGEGNKTLAMVGAVADFSGAGLEHWLGEMALGRTGQVELVDGQGTVLLTTGGAEVLPPEGHAVYFAGLMSEGKPTVTVCYDCHATATGTDRRRDVMVFAPLKTANWGIMLRQSEDEVLEPTRRLQQQVLALGAVSLLVALFVVWLTSRSVVSPIRALTSSARRIAEGDLGEAVLVRGSDEIGELSHALDYMRGRLQRSMEEIKGYNAELDRRVQERTAELEKSRDDLEQSRDHLEALIDRLSTLNALAVALNRSLDLGAILDGALENALKLTGMEAGAVYLVDRTTGELHLAARRGLSREAAQVAMSLGLSAGLFGSTSQTEQVVVVEDTTRYARGSRSALLSESMRCMVCVPFESTAGPLGTMCLGCGTPRGLSQTEVELLISVSNQIAVAVQNARLYEELQRREQMRGELLQKVIAAQEEERKRIARELHDQTSQALAALGLAVETATAQAAEGGDVGGSLTRMRMLAMNSLESVHQLIFDLRPTLLDDLGLIAALRWYAESKLGEVGIKLRLEVAGEERRLAPQVETALYRVVQEAVNNVANHSGAQNFTVTLVLRADSLSLMMMDDGWGFDMAELARSPDRKRGLGLMGMEERIELLGGTFAIYSELGGGTKITVEVPLLEGESEGDG